MVFVDVIISGKDEIEKNGILKEVLDHACANNVRFNPIKFQFPLSGVKYVGRVASSEGLKPDPEKVMAIVKYPQIQPKEDLHYFLVLVNYLGEFVSNLSAILESFHILLKSDTEWHWFPA